MMRINSDLPSFARPPTSCPLLLLLKKLLLPLLEEWSLILMWRELL